MVRAIIRTAAVASAVALGAAGGAHAASSVSWCSQSGDVCRSLSVVNGAVVAEEFLAAKYYSRSTICTRAPGERERCRRATVRRSGAGFAARVRVGTRPGVYRIRTYDSRISLRVTAADLTVRSRVCRPVADPPRTPSPVTAVNLGCASARALVRATQLRGRVAPSGWEYLNPAGCEGVIVRARDADAFVRAGYRSLPGRPSVITNIQRGCRS